MAQYTEEFLAAARQRYVETDVPLRLVAAELQIGDRDLQRMAMDHGWPRRSERVHGLPIAVQLLKEAKALAASGPHPSRLGEERLAPQDDGANAAPPTPNPSPPLVSLVEGGESSAIDRLEALVVKEIATAEAACAQSGGKKRPDADNARTLATLTQTLRALHQMRAGKPLEPEMTDDDDDMPRDIDEFRHALARRIEAFVASHADDEDADEESGSADVDAAG